MTDLLTCRKLSKAYTSEALFEELDIGVREGDRLGLIGPNGAGKSTLLKIMAGLETADEGEVIARKGLRRVYIPQAAEFDEELAVVTVITRAATAAGVREDEREAAVNLTLGKAGFTDPDARVATLSGGWRKRLTLACGLVGQGDLLLFDEPTNHLDLAGVLWLEQLLATAPFAWVLVSHDRYFLNRTATRIAELNPIFPEGVLATDGDYGRYQAWRASFLEGLERQKEALANKVRRETEWLNKSPKARTTKARFRIKAAWQLIETLETLKAAESDQPAGIDFVASGRRTRKLVELRAVGKSRGGRKILENLDLVLSPGTRLGLLGGNGSGKTTLLRLIAKELAPDRGEVVHAPELKMVSFDQQRDQLDPNQTLARALSETGETVIYRGRPLHLVGWARRFRFTVDQLPLPVGELSGGEQARLLIARLMLLDADILLLDEPTNDLDIGALETLEESLARFAGALVLVTHDRYMLGRLCDRFIGLDGSGGHLAVAGYDQWERSLREGDKKADKKTEAGKRQKSGSAKMSYKDQRELVGMEERILAAEEILATREAEAADPAIASDGPRLLAAHEALTVAQAEVTALYERWAELGEMAEG